MPLLLIAGGGRQTTISATEGTGQTRIQLWSDWLDEFRANPVFGAGMQLGKEEDVQKERLPGDSTRHLAHNGYLQAFADLGFVGGCLFLGAFGLALFSVYRLGGPGTIVADPVQQAIRPFVLASIAAWATGIMTLSITYLVPTYLMLGLAVCFTRATPCWPPPAPLRLDGRILGRFALAGIAFLAWTYMMIRLFVHW
jgi:O-antigen ligase